MEAEIVLGVTSFGVIISILLLIDVIKDRTVASNVEPYDPALVEVARHQIVGEVFRLVVLCLFWIAAFMAIVHGSRVTIRLLVVFIPIIITVWSVYAWARRKRLLREKEEANDE